MNAVNPVPSPASGAEPSMEEILASIRRIIADDQPLPGAAAREPVRAEAAIAEVTVAETLVEAMPPEQGMVATPQFPTPEGPAAGVMDTPHPLAPATPEAPTAAPEPAPTTAHVALPEPDLHEATLRRMHEEEDARAAVVNAAHDHVYEGQFFEEPLHKEPVEEPAAPEALRHQPAAEEAPMQATGEVPPRDQRGAGLFSAATSQSLAAAFNTLAISRLADNSEELRGLARDMLRPLLKDWLNAHLPGLVESIIREEIDQMARRTR